MFHDNLKLFGEEIIIADFVYLSNKLNKKLHHQTKLYRSV